MDTFYALLAICAGNSPVTGEFPSQSPVTRTFSLIYVWIDGWVNNGEAGDLRRHRAHYDVTVLKWRYASTRPSFQSLQCCLASRAVPHNWYFSRFDVYNIYVYTRTGSALNTLKLTKKCPDHISKWFFLMEICKFRLIFHWSLFPRFQLTIAQHPFR